MFSLELGLFSSLPLRALRLETKGFVLRINPNGALRRPARQSTV
jgi:hypothetical protein